MYQFIPFMIESYSIVYVYITNCLQVHLSLDIQVFSTIFAIVNTARESIHEQVFVV